MLRTRRDRQAVLMVRTDEARPRRRSELGDVTRGDLAAWVSPHHGYHRQSELNDPVRQRILDASAVMPAGAAVGGWAAAYLHGATQLDGRDQPVPLMLPPAKVVDRPGIEISRVRLDPADIVLRQRIPCTSGVRTTFDLLRLAPDLTEAVVAGDCALRSGLCREGDVLGYATTHRRRRGLRQLRAAVRLLDPASASPPESRLRMLCLDAGLPPMLVNIPVHDLAGNFLGIPDLLEPTVGLAAEYDGEHHRELGQHTADNLREERLEAHGLAVVRVTALDMKDPAALADRLQAAYHQQRLRAVIPGWTIQFRPAA